MKRAMLLGLSLALSTGALARESLDEATGGAASSLAAATAAAWRLAIEAREAEAVKAGAEAEQSAPGMWWADPPSLELSHRTGDWGNNPGQRESEVAVAIPMWLPGQRSSAREASAANLEHAAAAVALARLDVAGKVRELAWTLAAVEAELSGASAAMVSMRALADDVERRVGAGESPRTELLAARAELIAAESRETELRRSKQTSLAQWTVLTESPPLADPTESGAALPPGDADAMSLADHPAVRVAVFATERARARQKLSRDAPVAAPELRILIARKSRRTDRRRIAPRDSARGCLWVVRPERHPSRRRRLESWREPLRQRNGRTRHSGRRFPLRAAMPNPRSAMPGPPRHGPVCCANASRCSRRRSIMVSSRCRKYCASASAWPPWKRIAGARRSRSAMPWRASGNHWEHTVRTGSGRRMHAPRAKAASAVFVCALAAMLAAAPPPCVGVAWRAPGPMASISILLPVQRWSNRVRASKRTRKRSNWLHASSTGACR